MKDDQQHPENSPSEPFHKSKRIKTAQHSADDGQLLNYEGQPYVQLLHGNDPLAAGFTFRCDAWWKDTA